MTILAASSLQMPAGSKATLVSRRKGGELPAVDGCRHLDASVAKSRRRDRASHGSRLLAEGEELGSNLLRAVHSSCRYPGRPDLDREIGEPPGGVSRPSRAVPLGFEITPYQPDR